MSEHFVKLSANIVTSSVWAEDSDTLRVWIYLLAMADPAGVVRVTVPGLAVQCGLTVEVAREILAKFEAPDPDSRTATNEGRRIRIEREPQFAIRVVNYGTYRQLDYTHAERQRRYRERKTRDASRDVTVTASDTGRSRSRKDKDSPEPEVPASGPASRTLLEFPVVGKVKTWPFTEAVRDEYAALFPTLNVEASARRALHWVAVEHPTRKKTAGGMHRYLAGWFSRAVNKGEDLRGAGGVGNRAAVSAEDLEALRRAREENAEVTR